MGRYIIKVWETEQNRELGESNIIESSLDDIDSAIQKAKRIMNLNNYASLEVQTSKENKTLYFTAKNEEKIFKDEIDEEKKQEKINIYAKFVYDEKATDNMEEIYGKSKDVISILKENKKYCNSPEVEFDEDELKSINKSLDSLINDLKNNYLEDDFVFLFEHPMDSELHIQDSEELLKDLYFYYLSKVEEETELKDININEFIMCYFDNNKIENLMDYGSDRDSLSMPSISDLYKEILDTININYDNVLTDDISDGKYSVVINFDEKNSIQLDVRASDTYIETASNIQDIVDKYLELQKQNSITEENDMEL